MDYYYRPPAAAQDCDCGPGLGLSMESMDCYYGPPAAAQGCDCGPDRASLHGARPGHDRGLLLHYTIPLHYTVYYIILNIFILFHYILHTHYCCTILYYHMLVSYTIIFAIIVIVTACTVSLSVSPLSLPFSLSSFPQHGRGRRPPP